MKSFIRYTGTIALGLLIVVVFAGVKLARSPKPAPSLDHPSTNHTTYMDKDWERILTPEQYHILREEGTEIPFTSPLVNEHRSGTYVTADCGDPVFRSEQKFDSGTGWPSFWAPITPDAVTTSSDKRLVIERTEVRSRCGGHLGHVFQDGPEPTGLRYCINGAALTFIPDKEKPNGTSYK